MAHFMRNLSATFLSALAIAAPPIATHYELAVELGNVPTNPLISSVVQPIMVCDADCASDMFEAFSLLLADYYNKKDERKDGTSVPKVSLVDHDLEHDLPPIDPKPRPAFIRKFVGEGQQVFNITI